MFSSKDYLKITSALGTVTIQQDSTLYPEQQIVPDKQDMEVVKIGDEK